MLSVILSLRSSNRCTGSGAAALAASILCYVIAQALQSARKEERVHGSFALHKLDIPPAGGS
eukprot:4466377-Amphidinium_carterae.1